MKDLIISLATPGNIAIAVTGFLGLVALLFAPDALRKRRIALAVFHGYRIAVDVAAETEGQDAADIVAAALKAADEYMKANGWRPLKEGELTLAKLQVSSEAGSLKAAAQALSSPQ